MTDRDQAIANTFAKAFALVDEAEKAERSGDTSSYRLLLWKCAAEVEYLAFQVSVLKGLADYHPAAEKEQNDASVRMLLEEAQTWIHSDPRRAHRALRNAVSALRRPRATLLKSDSKVSL